MSGVPYIFGNATTSIPLSQLDVNFATNATIGTTSVGLGNTTTTLVGLTNVSTTVVNTSNVSANTSLLLQTNGTTTAVTIDNSQNVGLGVTPSAWGSRKALEVGNAGSALFSVGANQNYLTSNSYFDGAFKYGATGTATAYQQYAGTHAWLNAASGSAGGVITFTQAMSLDASGNLVVGTTSAINSANTFSGSGTYNLVLNNTGQYTQLGFCNSGTTKAAQYWDNTAGRFYVYAGGSSYGVYLATNGVVWVTNSDERLKDIIEPISDATSKVSSLRAVIGKYKIDEEGTRRSFLIAQDVQKVLPEAVDASDPNKLGVQYTDVIPLLVAAIQELSAQVTTLQTQVTALQTKVGV